MLYSRISSGLDFLDASIGGLFSNRSYLLRGPTQSGRTTVTLQFMLAGLENGENCMMISSDRIENVILKAEAIGISLETFLLENRLVLMEYPKEILGGNYQYGSIIHLLGEIEEYLQDYRCSRLVFDTLLPLLSNPRETQLVNYVYSLMNSLEALHVTTMVTTGEPNSPVAVQVIQLIEDSVVGSFALSTKMKQDVPHRSLTIHKMVSPLNPPTTFPIRFEFGTGVVQDIEAQEPAHEKPVPKRASKSLGKVPLKIVLIGDSEDMSSEVEGAFEEKSDIKMIDDKDSLLHHLHHQECDLLIIDADSRRYNWQELVFELREMYPKQAIFLIAESLSKHLTYQSAKAIGANGLFLSPVVPMDLLKAFEKSLRKFGTLEDILEKRSMVISPQELPDDLAVNGSGAGHEDDIPGTEEADLLSPQAFKDRLHRQILRSSQDHSHFALASFKMIYTPEMAKQSHLPQGLELVKKVASIVNISLRGVNDTTCRYMEKVVVLLEDTDTPGARAFTRRIVKQVKESLSSSLNVQIGKHLNILTAVTSYPEDGDNASDLLAQVTDVTRYFVKTPVG